MKTSYFISDLHLCEKHNYLNILQNWLKSITSTCEHLYVLGDLFEVWVGDDFEDNISSSTAKLFYECNFQVSFCHGNRDFLLGEEYAKKSGMQLMSESTIIKLGNDEILLTHGDQFCIDDIEHQQYRKQTRNRAWQQEILSLPLKHRLQKAEELRRKSRKSTSMKSDEIMDVNSEHIKNIFSKHSSLRYIIHGHTHLPFVHDYNIHGNNVKRLVLGDWRKEGFYFAKIHQSKLILQFQAGHYG